MKRVHVVLFMTGRLFCLPGSGQKLLEKNIAGSTGSVKPDRGAHRLQGRGKLASSLVILRQLFQPFPLLLVMTENHQPDMLPFDQIKQFHRSRTSCHFRHRPCQNHAFTLTNLSFLLIISLSDVLLELLLDILKFVYRLPSVNPNFDNLFNLSECPPARGKLIIA